MRRPAGARLPELIRRKGPWRGLDAFELATMEWIEPCPGTGTSCDGSGLLLRLAPGRAAHVAFTTHAAAETRWDPEHHKRLDLRT
jgi:hypothetical protein